MPKYVLTTAARYSTWQPHLIIIVGKPLRHLTSRSLARHRERSLRAAGFSSLILINFRQLEALIALTPQGILAYTSGHKFCLVTSVSTLCECSFLTGVGFFRVNYIDLWLYCMGLLEDTTVVLPWTLLVSRGRHHTNFRGIVNE